MKVTRIFDLLERMKSLYPKDDAICRRVNGKWVKYSTKEYYNISHNLAMGFISMNLNKHDKVITLCNNRPEWNFIDMALSMANLVHVPVYTTLSNDDYKYIFEHSEAKVIIVGNETLLKKIYPVINSLNNVPQIFTMDEVTGIKHYSEISNINDNEKKNAELILNQNKENIAENDICTIIYTSGTTGTPKGVMLSHKNLVFNFIGHAVQQIKDSSNKMLSFLPLCHIYERSMNYEYQYLGIGIYYAESLSTIASDLADCKADGFCAVPRVLEMMFNKLEAAGKDLKGVKRWIYSWAFHFACDFDYSKKGKFYNFKHTLADKLIYSKWREKLGGNEMLIVSGGSAIQAKIIRLFTAAKMYIFEGYGMTEASPVIAVNNPKEMIIKIGTVGKAMEGTELKIAEDGEILTRGPHVMLGYYKDPEYTKTVIDDEGWLHTGDIGHIIEGIFLQITDRKKEIFKLSAGKYIAPQVIENMLKESSYIENCIVVGENQKFASALIIPDFNRLHFWAAKYNLHYSNNDELISLAEVQKKINSEIEKVNRKLAPFEHIKRAKLINDEWTPINGMLSQTLKLKRNNIKTKYFDTINDIFKLDN